MPLIDEEYLAFVRGWPCALCGADPPSDADHILNRQWRQVARNDYVTAPLCRVCHTMKHSVGLTGALNARGLTVARFVQSVVMQLVQFHRLKAKGLSVDPRAPF